MNYAKLSAGLGSILESFERGGAAAVNSKGASLLKSLGVIARERTDEVPKALVFVELHEAQQLPDVELNHTSSRIKTAYLTLEQIARLSEDDKVKRISRTRYLKPCVDNAASKIQLANYVNRTGRTGKNVIIGVVDSGLDSEHPAFFGRVLKIWDQTLTPVGSQSVAYGRELAGNSMLKSMDTDGHGTHVAGIAAGGEKPYLGVAPGAQLIIVKTDFNNAHIADAVRYIFREARELNLSAVVNLSLGGHGDPHDGTDDLSQVVDEVSGPGRIVCCAAGNEGLDPIHSQVVVGPVSEARAYLKVPTGISELLIQGWYAGTGSLELSVVSPAGFHTDRRSSSTSNYVHNQALGAASVTVETPGRNPDNGDFGYLVQLKGTLSGTWQLVFKNVGAATTAVDSWIFWDSSERIDASFVGPGSSDSMKIGSPGTSAQAITVASFNTRVEWTDSLQAQRGLALKFDDISDFSSPGPLRNGAQKPDLTAPGAVIIAPTSADSTVPEGFSINEFYRGNLGTSMASPCVAGVVALMLEGDPTLTPGKVKAALKPHCQIPGRPAGDFDSKWGFGLLDLSQLI